MKLSRSSTLISTAWLVFLGGYFFVSFLSPHVPVLENFSYVIACTVALFCNTCLLWNAASSYRRQNGFWMLLALGCTFWLTGMLILVYSEFARQNQTEPPYIAALLSFLHAVPFMAAIALRPPVRKMRAPLGFGLIDLLLLGIVWLY